MPLLSFIQSLGLSFFKAIPFSTEKMGGYVSENYLGLCRAIKWMYGSLLFAAADKTFVQPDTPQDKWLKTQNVAWLKIRGLNTEGYAPEVRERVRQYMEQEGGPPAIVPPKGGPLPLVLDVVKALNVMVASIMVTEVTPDSIRVANCNIKIFLTLFERLDAGMRDKGEDPIGVTSYNFVCLLNLPKLMEQFGPLRNLWEGSFQGEGILRYVKPEVGMGVRVNWSLNVMINLLQSKALSQISSGKNDTGDTGAQGKRMLYHRYRSKAKLLLHLREGKPLSVIWLNGLACGCAISATEYLPLKKSQGLGLENNGHYFHTWTLEHDNPRPYEVAHIVYYTLFLPALGPEGYQGTETSYTAIDSDWNDIDLHGTRFEPPVANYSTI